jgi:nicotinamidase-related amidase
MSGTTGLLVLDMFNLFDFPGGAALARASARMLPTLCNLRARFDRAGAPVIHVNDNFAHWRGDLPELLARCERAGGIPARIATTLAPASAHYHVLKPRHSGFSGTALALLLHDLGVRRLVVTGVAADACVLATVLEANMHHYTLWIPGDCVASRTPALKHHALALMRNSIHARTLASTSCTGIFPAEA